MALPPYASGLKTLIVDAVTAETEGALSDLVELANAYANSDTDADIPGAAPGERGAKYWAGEAADSIAEFKATLTTGLITPSQTVVEGQFIDRNTGLPVVFSGFRYVRYELTGDEESLFASALVGGTAVALAVYYAANGTTVLGNQFLGTTTNVLYTDQLLTLPAGTAFVAVSGRNSSPVVIKYNRIRANIATDLDANIADTSRVKESLTGWQTPTFTSNPGFYIDRFTGAQVALSSFQNIVYTLTGTELGFRATALVSGSATALAVYYSASGTVLGTEFTGPSSGNVQYTAQTLTVPTGTASIGITGRVIGDISIEVLDVLPSAAESIAENTTAISGALARIDVLETDVRSYWTGKKLLWMGTSIPEGVTTSVTIGGITSQNSYPRMVEALLGANVTNVALGSSIARAGIFANKNSGAGDPLGWTGLNWVNLSRSLSHTAADKDELINNWVSKWRDLVGGTSKPTTLDSGTQALWRGASYEERLVPNLDADLFLFDHGNNDLAVAPGGYTGTELMDRFNANPASRDRTTFHGAINALIDIILASNSKARICFVGHYENARKSQISLVQSAMSAFWDFPIIELWRYTGWSQQVITGSGADAGKTMTQVWMPDDLHPYSDTTGAANFLIASILSEQLRLIR